MEKSDSLAFRSALRSGDLIGLTRVPKSDLHIHSILGTRIERIEKWLGQTLTHAPARMHSLDEMIKYAQDVIYPHTVTRAGFEFTTESAILDAIDDGVRVMEMSLDVRFISLFNKGLDEYFSFVSTLLLKFKPQIDFRAEIGMSKDRPAPEQIDLAWACIDSGLFQSIDLYGNETAQPVESFQRLYSFSRKRGLKLKAHAGEFAGPYYIERTLQLLELDEIQHGVRSASSKELMDRLRREHIRLNVCPSSNVALGVVDDIAHHPIRTLFDNGIRVTINSDDLMIFGSSVSQEYLLLHQSGLLSADELDSIRLEGLSS